MLFRSSSLGAMNIQFQKLVSAVVPEAGDICIFSKHWTSGAVAQAFFPDVEQAEAFVDEQHEKRYETYFGCMTFAPNPPHRFVKHVHGYRTLFIDIDCGPEKKYSDQETALAALSQFVRMRRLPKPWVVSSGNGIHCYFPFEDTVDYNIWVFRSEEHTSELQSH